MIATLFEPGTALALEPYPPATLESILWCRPTHVVAHADEVAELVGAWSGKVPKRSRLRRVLVTGGEVGSGVGRDAGCSGCGSRLGRGDEAPERPGGARKALLLAPGDVDRPAGTRIA